MLPFQAFSEQLGNSEAVPLPLLAAGSMTAPGRQPALSDLAQTGSSLNRCVSRHMHERECAETQELHTDGVMVHIRAPKAALRGMGKQQYSAFDDKHVADFLAALQCFLSWRSPMWPLAQTLFARGGTWCSAF